jgi:DcmR-like sensory protein
MVAWENRVLNYHVNDALDHINQAEHGAHYMIIYPDLDTLRKLYSSYVHKQIKDNNEIVLINPFYETTDSVRQVLSEKYNDGMNSISKYEKEESLIVIDSLEEYFGQQPDMTFKRNLANHAKQAGRNGLSILGDIGAYPHKSKHKDLVDYESSLPAKYDDVPMRGFCLYHQRDFDNFSDEQKQKLAEHHEKAIKIMNT